MDIRENNHFFNMDLKIHYYENTMEGWKQLEDDIINDNLQIEDNKIIIGTWFQKEFEKFGKEEKANYITNFQFLFILIDRLKKMYEGIQIGLIILSDNNGCHRLKAYLLCKYWVENNIYIKLKVSENNTGNFEELVNNSKREVKFAGEDNFMIGKIFPLIRVSANPDEVDGISYASLVEKNQEIYVKIKEILEQRNLTKDELSELKKARQINTVSGILKKSAQLQIINMLIGKDKRSPIQEVCYDVLNYIVNRIKNISLLSQIIWIQMLSRLFEQHLLFKNSDDGQINQLDENILGRSFFDACVYSEGLEELLENSCQYSEQHAGYLSIIMHDVNLGCGYSDMVDIARKREYLWRMYRESKGDKVFGQDTKLCLEIQLSDDAYSLSEMHTVGIMQTQGAENYTMEELFERKRINANNDINCILHHYGMNLFRHTIILNGGRFSVISPSKEGAFDNYFSRIKNSYHKSIIISSPATTIYRMLIPIRECWEECTPDIELNLGQPTISRYQELERYNVRNKAGKDLFENISKTHEMIYEKEEFLRQEEKIQLTQNIMGLLDNCFKSENKEILVINLNKIGSCALELFTKALFGFLHNEAETEKLIALYFSSDQTIKEFIKYVRVLYDNYGELEWMESVQIAICGSDIYCGNDGNPIPVVKMLLAGEKLSSLLVSVYSYIYYNSTVSLDIISELRKLAETEMPIRIKATKKIPQFPFDLILSGKFEEIKPDIHNSWFLQRMKCVVESELQEKNMGCKISNAHIRIGSKIHIKDFYEAELLFHNVSYVSRFAFLLALYISQKNVKKEGVVLVGYEVYSLILIKKVGYYLEELGISSEQIIYMKDKKGKERILFESIKKKVFSGIPFVAILPIGTTLSTIYKIRNVLQRQLAGKGYIGKGETIYFCSYYAMLLVDQKDSEKVDSKQKIREKFWEYSNENTYTVKLKKEKKSQIESVEVTFFMKTKTDWYNPEECPLCQTRIKLPKSNRTALIDVDKTSTLPKAVFPLKKSRNRGISFNINESNKKKNEIFINLLKDCVTYAHIESGNNHFQFYIHFDKYYRNCTSSENVDACKYLREWFDDQKKSINISDFHIIVSPLELGDSSFLADVVEYIFENNARLFFVPISTVYKEDIRAKFSYFAEEFRYLESTDTQTKINVYYVDNSIITGQTLQRGKKLIQMLMAEAGIDINTKVRMYRKIFLLLNRSSYDTALSFVKNPEQDYCAVATLAIPSFNTLEGMCPTCELTEKYKEIAKCSASNEMYWYYMWLAERREKKSIQEFDNWLPIHLLNEPHYYQELVVWLAFHASEKKNGINIYKELLENIYNKIKCRFRMTERENEISIEEMSNLSLKSIFETDLNLGNDQLCKECIELLRQIIIPEKTFMRLKESHYAMILLDSENEWNSNQLKEKMVEYLSDNILQSKERIYRAAGSC